MSKIEDLKMLNYLHDAEVQRLVYYAAGSDYLRCIDLSVHCHNDCGHEPWNDKEIVLTFVDCVMAGGYLCGHMWGADSINGFDIDDLMPEVEKKLALTLSGGIRGPLMRISVCFHSGSELSIACDEVKIAIQDRRK